MLLGLLGQADSFRRLLVLGIMHKAYIFDVGLLELARALHWNAAFDYADVNSDLLAAFPRIEHGPQVHMMASLIGFSTSRAQAGKDERGSSK